MSDLRTQWLFSGIPIDVLDILERLVRFEQRVTPSDIASACGLFEEFEIKSAADDLIFSRLAALGGKCDSSALENNIVYDFPNMQLHRVDARLRVRHFIPLNNTTPSALLTVKKPRPVQDSFGVREFEAELALSEKEADHLVSDLVRAGFIVVSSYQRIRHSIRLATLPVKVDVDLFPDIGRYMEIEGDEKAALDLARELGVGAEHFIPLPYDTLHEEWLIARGQVPTDFIRFSGDISEVIAEERKYLSILL